MQPGFNQRQTEARITWFTWGWN